jgi:hypothetical protein
MQFLIFGRILAVEEQMFRKKPYLIAFMRLRRFPATVRGPVAPRSSAVDAAFIYFLLWHTVLFLDLCQSLGGMTAGKVLVKKRY